MGVDTEKFLVLGYSLDVIGNSVFDSDLKTNIKDNREIPGSWLAKNRKFKGLLQVFCVDYYDDEDPDSNYILGFRLGKELSNGLEIVDEKEIASCSKLLSSLFKKEPSVHLVYQQS